MHLTCLILAPHQGKLVYFAFDFIAIVWQFRGNHEGGHPREIVLLRRTSCPKTESTGTSLLWDWGIPPAFNHVKKTHFSRHNENDVIKKKLSAVTKSKIESHKEGPPIPTHACYVYTLCLCCAKWITWIIFSCMFDKCYSHSILTPTYTTRSSFPLIHNPNFFQDIVFFSAH